MNHQREKRVNCLQEDHHLKSLIGDHLKSLTRDIHHKSSYQDNSLLSNGVEKNRKLQSSHLEQYVLHLLGNQEVVERLIIVVVVRNPGVNLEANLHVIVTRNPEAGHEISTRDLNHVSELVGEAGHHVTEIEGAGHEISVGGVGHVIVLGEVDHVIVPDEVGHVKGTGEEMDAELAIDMIERKILVLVIRTMRAVNLKSEYAINISIILVYYCRVADYELESEEDEEALIERRRQKRLAIVAKYSGVNSQVGFVNDYVILVVVIVTSVRWIW